MKGARRGTKKTNKWTIYESVTALYTLKLEKKSVYQKRMQMYTVYSKDQILWTGLGRSGEWYKR